MLERFEEELFLRALLTAYDRERLDLWLRLIVEWNLCFVDKVGYQRALGDLCQLAEEKVLAETRRLL